MVWSERIHWIPICIIVLVPITLIFCYTLSLAHQNLQSYLPYVSDAAATMPTAAYFTQLLHLISVLIVLTFAVRHLQIEALLSDCESTAGKLESMAKHKQKILLANQLSTYTALLIALFISMVGSFRVSEYVVVHTLSAVSVFVCGPILYGLQTWMSFRLEPIANSLRVAKLRLYITVVTALIVLSVTSFTVWSFLIMRDYISDISESVKWPHNETIGSLPYFVGALSEWVYILMICPFVATYVSEFKRIHIHDHRLYFV